MITYTKNENKESAPTIGEIDLSYKPLPGSRKIYEPGKIHTDIRIPFREIQQSPTVDHNNQKTPNPTLRLYDTSGPYSDPTVKIDITQGPAPLRKEWIARRQDVVTLTEATSQYRENREADPALEQIRFPNIRRPLRSKTGRNV